MVRLRFIYCGIAAAFILSGEVQAQDSVALRTSLDAPQPDPGTIDATDQPEAPAPLMLAAKPTTLEVNPLVEPPPPLPRKRGAEAEEDPYAALGIEAGGLTLFPVFRAGAVFSDNPGTVETDRKGDFGVRLRPSLRITSDWIRHELSVEGSGDLIYYNNETENDSKEAAALARLRLDVLRSTTLTLEANYTLADENGSDSEVPDTAIGNRTDQSLGSGASLTHRFGRLATTLRAGADVQYYGDVELAGGGEERNADREYVEPEALLRVAYETSPAFKPFVEAAYTPRFHFEDRDRNGFDRNSDGYRVAVGVGFDPSPLWSGELALTYQWRDYDDSRLETLDTFGVAGIVTWRPTELTTLDLTLGTGLEETAVDGSSGARTYDARLGISHDLRDYLTLRGSAGLSYEDFQGADETELQLRSNAGVLWRMNRWLAWTFDYDFIYNDNNQPGLDYYENRITAGIEVRR
jgi:hypothetical protein